MKRPAQNASKIEHSTPNLRKSNTPNPTSTNAQKIHVMTIDSATTANIYSPSLCRLSCFWQVNTQVPILNRVKGRTLSARYFKSDKAKRLQARERKQSAFEMRARRLPKTSADRRKCGTAIRSLEHCSCTAPCLPTVQSAPQGATARGRRERHHTQLFSGGGRLRTRRCHAAVRAFHFDRVGLWRATKSGRKTIKGIRSDPSSMIDSVEQTRV